MNYKQYILKRKNELLLLVLYIFLVLTVLAYLSSDFLISLFSAAGCHLYNYTGLYCPACGGTRAMTALLNGDITGALRFNLLIVLLPLFVYPGLILIKMVLKGDSVKYLRISPVILWGLPVLVLLFGLLRNIPASVFELLRPP